jgi:DDE superfamily endonuclease
MCRSALFSGGQHRGLSMSSRLSSALDAAYPADTAIKLILDNHSAHISKETKAWLAAQPEGRFQFTFTPKHGSWLNLIEGFFSRLARTVLRHIRVASKQELKDRSWLPSMTLTDAQSSTHGPTGSKTLPDHAPHMG